MSHRSRKHKKRFNCGHRGYGQYCHCCAERVAHKQKRSSQRRRQREQWQDLFADDAGLFHSKNGLEGIQAKFAETFSLSHIGERIGAVKINREVTGDREDLR